MTNTTLSTHNILDWEKLISSPPNKYDDRTPLNFSQDPLALSWASYHVWIRDPVRRWVDLNDVQAHNHDFAIADQTRHYYRDRLTMDALKGRELSNFQKALYEIAENQVQLQQRHLGVIYRLPYFYVEDVERASILSTFSNFPKTGNLNVDNVRELTYVKTVLRSRRSGDTDEHWFRDHNGQPVLWKVDSRNHFQKFLKSFCQTHQEKPISIRGTYLLRENPVYPTPHWILVQPELA